MASRTSPSWKWSQALGSNYYYDERSGECVLPSGQRIPAPTSIRQQVKVTKPAPTLERETSESDEDKSEDQEEGEDTAVQQPPKGPLPPLWPRPMALGSNGIDARYMAQMSNLSLESTRASSAGRSSGNTINNTTNNITINNFQNIQNNPVTIGATSPTPRHSNGNTGRNPYIPASSSADVDTRVTRPDPTLFTARMLPGGSKANGRYDTGADDNFVTESFVQQAGLGKLMRELETEFEGVNGQSIWSYHTIALRWFDQGGEARSAQYFVLEDIGDYDMLIGNDYIQQHQVFARKPRPVFKLKRKVQSKKSRAGQTVSQDQQSDQAAQAVQARLALPGWTAADVASVISLMSQGYSLEDAKNIVRAGRRTQ